jgi:hypothetical protein
VKGSPSYAPPTPRLRRATALQRREWLARKLAAREIRCTRLDNVFAWTEDLPQAQRLSAPADNSST